MLQYQAEPLDHAFHALSDPGRRAMVERLSLGPASVSELARPLPMTLSAVVQHLKVLEEADLVIARKDGRERWNHLNSLPIKHIYDRWISAYAGHALSILDRLKGDLEGQPE